MSNTKTQQPKVARGGTVTFCDDYYQLPVINWKVILGEKKKSCYTQRPRRMHATLNLGSALFWIEAFFGIPQNAIQFLNPDGSPVPEPDLDSRNVKSLLE